jgi:hypothetical protein
MIGMLLFINVVMGIVSRIAPQMNVFAIGFPMTLSVGLLGIAFTLPMLDRPVMQLMLHLDAGIAVEDGRHGLPCLSFVEIALHAKALMHQIDHRPHILFFQAHLKLTHSGLKPGLGIVPAAGAQQQDQAHDPCHQHPHHQPRPVQNHPGSPAKKPPANCKRPVGWPHGPYRPPSPSGPSPSKGRRARSHFRAPDILYPSCTAGLSRSSRSISS